MKNRLALLTNLFKSVEPLSLNADSTGFSLFVGDSSLTIDHAPYKNDGATVLSAELPSLGIAHISLNVKRVTPGPRRTKVDYSWSDSPAPQPEPIGAEAQSEVTSGKIRFRTTH